MSECVQNKWSVQDNEILEKLQLREKMVSFVPYKDIFWCFLGKVGVSIQDDFLYIGGVSVYNKLMSVYVM